MFCYRTFIISVLFSATSFLSAASENVGNFSESCGGTLTTNNSQISFQDHDDGYQHNVDCVWRIEAPDGYIIQLEFITFDLEPKGQLLSICFDYVLVEDASGNRIGRFCGDKVPPLITRMDNVLIVKFHSDESVSKAGFSARYVFLNAAENMFKHCGGNISQTSGVITSPGYPNSYPALIHCIWFLHDPSSSQITLNVTDFKVEPHSSCTYDHLEIRDLGNPAPFKKYCGTSIPAIIQSHSNHLRLDFMSDETNEEKGFRIHFSFSNDSNTANVTGVSGIEETTTLRSRIVTIETFLPESTKIETISYKVTGITEMTESVSIPFPRDPLVLEQSNLKNETLIEEITYSSQFTGNIVIFLLGIILGIFITTVGAFFVYRYRLRRVTTTEMNTALYQKFTEEPLHCETRSGKDSVVLQI